MTGVTVRRGIRVKGYTQGSGKNVMAHWRRVRKIVDALPETERIGDPLCPHCGTRGIVMMSGTGLTTYTCPSCGRNWSEH